MTWRALAWLLSRPLVAGWLLRRAVRTPYSHIRSEDGRDVYMYRWWLFNPYPASGEPPRWAWPSFSVRVHRIMRRDCDRHLHDHPWNARTIILDGYYVEVREGGAAVVRGKGDTAALKFGEFHRIDHVSPGGVLTLFITWRYQGTWGFLVDGRKVPHREYLAGRSS